MEFKDFATGVVAEAARAALDATPPDAARAAHNAGLLADMLSAAAGAVEAAEWLWVWSRGAVPLCCHRGLEANCRERLGRAALAFMRAWGEGADGQAVRDLLATVRADAGHAPFEWRSLLALQIDLLCLSPPAAFPAEHVAALLQQVFDAEDEDWISEQLSKVHEARRELPLPPGGQAEVARIWKSLGRRGGGSAGASVSAMRLSAIYGAHNISEEFIEGGLTHRTRATRRLAIELLGQLHGGAAWWPAWHSAFLVLSDEQPWHIVRPVWEDVTALGGLFKGAVPARWTSALVRRAAAHSDHRVVRHATADAIRHSAALDPAVVLAIIPAALGVKGGSLEGLAPALAAPALDVILARLPAPSAATAAAVEHAAGAAFEGAGGAGGAARASEALAKVVAILGSWRRSGASEAVLTRLGACALRGAAAHALPHGAFVDLGAPLASALPPRALRRAVEEAGVPAAQREAYVEAACTRTPCGLADAAAAKLASALYSQVHPEAFARRIRPGGGAFEPVAFAAAVAAATADVGAGGPNTTREGPGADSVSVWGLEFPAAPITAAVLDEAPEPVVPEPVLCDFLALAEACPAVANAAARRAAAALPADPSRALGVCLSIPPRVWAAHPDAGTVLAWCCDAAVPLAGEARQRLRLLAAAVAAIVPALPRAQRGDALAKAVEWVRGVALVHYGAPPDGDAAAAAAPPLAPAAPGKRQRKPKKQGEAGLIMAGVVELMQVVEECCASLAGEDAGLPAPLRSGLLQDLVVAAWGVVRRYPAKFSGSRTMYGAFFRAAVRREDVLEGLDGLWDELVPASSIVASQLTQAAWGTVGDPEPLAVLALFAPAPTACALDAQHPAAILACTSHPDLPGARRVSGVALAASVLKHVLRNDTPEGHDGSAAQLQRVRQWWLLVALLPQVDAATAEAIANAAVLELRSARVVPKTRVLVQNAWATACALHPDAGATLPLLLATLRAPATQFRLAVSSIIVAAHLLVGGAAAEQALLPAAWRERLLGAVVGWSLAMPHAARTHAQLVLAEYLDAQEARGEPVGGSAAEASLLGTLRAFLAGNPHLSALRSEAGLDKLVSVYLAPSARGGRLAAPLPPFEPLSVETRVLKALRLVQGRFGELDGEGADASAPTGSGRCPARDRGDDSDDAADDEDGAAGSQDGEAPGDPTHQRRPTPGRPAKAARARICVVGSFLDNLPNQAGLCRTVEALFGPHAEVTLASLKCTAEPAFLRMSMASERWLRLLEVPPGERLAAYLAQKRLEGYRIVALEQTDTSVPAQDYSFHRDTVLIVGNEQLGCPAWLLRRPELIHDFVELPLDGASRSLNAHVTASAMVWQFRLQTY